MIESITHAEWLAAFQDALHRSPHGDEGLTTEELSQSMGKCRSSITDYLRKIKTQGKLIRGYAYRESIDGRMMRVPVYRLT